MTGDRSQPRIILRYALYDKIASGGMATVHLGRLLGPVGFARTVAIKRLHAQFAEDPEFVSMFLEEARLVARIAHPNVVPTIDVVHSEGELFLVMEYVHGESLARLWRATQKLGIRVPPEMVVTMMVGVLHGLHAAHEARSERGEPLGIVHRDVSPQNILVGVDGAARVLDFGVAKSASRVQTTKEGQLKGKLSYMAPEQVRGKVSRASDIYAASIVLWELLVGQRLFVGENEGEVFDQVLQGCKTAPSSLVAGLPAALDTVTMRGLNLDPTQRFPTARAMARALEDAMPPVAPSKIGEWVESMMGERLSDRSKVIASIESDSLTAPSPDPSEEPAAYADPSPLPPLQPSASASPAIVARVPVQEDVVLTQLSTGISSPFRTSQVPRLPRRRARVAVGVGLAVVASLAALFLHRSTSPRSTSTEATRAGPESAAAPSVAEPIPIAAATSHADPVASVPAPPATPAPSAAPSAPAETATVPAPAHASTPPPRRSPVVPSPVPTAATPAGTHCNPPWYVDSRGVRVFKKECL